MRIGDYETLGLLGKGATSEVYEAEHVRVGSRHALKIYSYPHDDEEVRRRFEAEGRLLARLDHPRIVKVTDFGVDEASARPYFVMTLVAAADGKCRSLADVPAVDIDEETVGRWYDDIRDGLAYIHQKGIVHRDLKLQNVLVGPDGHAVLTDFGISRIFAPAEAKAAIANAVDTIMRLRDGKQMVMGSIGYMAPELEMGVAATPASDWYALGVIVYKLLTGTWCDSRTDLAATLETYAPVWMRILPGLLHSNPAGRTCLGYAEEITRVREQEEYELDKLRAFKRHRRMVRRWTSIAAAAAVLIACGVGAWHYGGLALDLARANMKLKGATFEQLFTVPETAGAQATDEMPSQEQFRAAMVDACVLTQGLFADFRRNKIDKAALKMQLGRMMHDVRRDYEGQFEDMPATYHPSGQRIALAALFKNAARKLK